MTGIIRYAQGDSSLGTFVSALSDRGLVMLEFGDLACAPLDKLQARFPEADLVHDPAFMQTALARLTQLIEHPEVRADLPLDMRGTEFELRIWNALRNIPAGQTVNYGEIAAKIGAPREAREVAQACAANTLAVIVPCHRGGQQGEGRQRLGLSLGLQAQVGADRTRAPGAVPACLTIGGLGGSHFPDVQRRQTGRAGATAFLFGPRNRGGSMMSSRIKGLPAEQFNHLFALSDEELARHGGVRRIADDRKPGYPCRVSLTDSQPGDELVLVNFEHLPVDTPYRMRIAIYVREGDKTYDAVDEVPEQLRTRMLAVRAFDGKGMMVGVKLVDGRELEGAIDALLAQPSAEYLHVHFAAPGCGPSGSRHSNCKELSAGR